MKIAFYSQNIGNYISGGRQYPWFLAHCLAYAGHEVLIITNTDVKNVLFDRDFVDFPGRSRVEIKGDFNWCTKDNGVMSRLKNFDLFICSPALSMDIGVAVAKNYHKKVIGLIYEPYNAIDEAMGNGIEILQPQQQFGPQNSLISDEVMDFVKQVHKTDMIITNCQYMRDKTKEWLPHYRGKVEYLYNGFNTNIADKIAQTPFNERENSVTYLSRTVKYKGFGDLLYFVSESKTKPRINFISGFLDMKQPLVHNFFKTCEKMNIDVKVFDRITELEKFKILSKTKLLVFPSRFEGFGIPPAEAFYMNTPVLCYDLPVLKEIYKEFPHYIPSFNFQDGPQVLDDIWADPFKDIRAAKKHVSEFCSVDNYTDKINEIVCKLTNKEFIKVSRKIVEKTIKEEITINENKLRDIVSQIPNIGIKQRIQYYKWNELYKAKAGIVTLHSENVKFSSKFEEEVNFRFEEQSCDFISFNHKIKDKEINLPGNDLEMLMVSPKCLGSVLTFKYDGVPISLQDNWELQLRILNLKKKWYHCRKHMFTLESKIEPNQKLVKRLIRDFVEDNELEQQEFNLKPLIIISVRTNQYLPKLLETLKKNIAGDLKVVFCHHCPDGKQNRDVINTISSYKYNPDNIMIVKGEFNFCKMNNDAFKKYGKDRSHVILCNDDVELEQLTIINLLAGFYTRFKNVGIVGAKLLFNNHKIQHAGVQLLKDNRCYHIYYKFPSEKLCVNYQRLCQAVTFGLVAIDAECYEQLMLNENYPNDLNDIDFCIRASQKGWDILYNPDACAIHHETVTRKEFKITDDYPARARFKKEHKELLSKQMGIQDLYSFQKHML